MERFVSFNYAVYGELSRNTNSKSKTISAPLASKSEPHIADSIAPLVNVELITEDAQKRRAHRMHMSLAEFHKFVTTLHNASAAALAHL